MIVWSFFFVVMDMEEDIKLIRLVEREAILYNKRSGNYKRSDLQAKIWRKIQEAMGFEGMLYFMFLIILYYCTVF